jgi:hypothetical protein
MTDVFPRRPDWQERLVQWATPLRGTAFRWGVTDCGSLVRGTLVALYGDPAEAALPRYQDARGAARVRQTVVSIEDELWRWGGMPVSRALAAAGDVVLERPASGELESAGVVLEGHVLVADATLGVTVAPWDTVRAHTIFHLPGA